MSDVDPVARPTDPPADGEPEVFPAGKTAPPEGEAEAVPLPAPDPEKEAQAREQAETVRQEAVRAYRKGERAYRAGLLEAGRLSHAYLVQRMALGDNRAAGVQALNGAFAAYSSSAVDVNHLIRTWWAYHLLCEQPGLKADVPYGRYRDHWSQLVERVNPNTKDECCILLPGLEDKAREAFAHAAKHGLGDDAVREAVKRLLSEYHEAQRAARQAEAERLRAEQEEAEQKRQEALAAAEKAQEDVLARQQAGEAEQAEQARKELLERQQAVAKANAEAEATRKARERAEQEAKEQAARAAKERGKADRASRGRRAEGRVVAVPLQRDGGEDPVRVAALVTDLLAGLAGGADAALDALLNRLIRSADVKISDGTRKVLRLAVAALGASPRAIDKAMLVLDTATRKEPESPVPVNGISVAA
jgi:hypothetical protein